MMAKKTNQKNEQDGIDKLISGLTTISKLIWVTILVLKSVQFVTNLVSGKEKK